MELVITPLKSVGSIEFGSTAETIRSVVSSPWETFLKDLTAPDEPTDAFDEAGFHVYYVAGRCEAVECFAPAELTLNGQQILGKPYRVIKQLLESMDANIQPYDSGIRARTLCISLYASNFSDAENLDAPVSGVLVGSRKYFDREDALLKAAGLL
jgi:hypothetical protein